MQDMLTQWVKMLAIHRDECIRESGVYEQDVREIENLLHFPNYYGFKSYMKCQEDRMKIMDAEGNFNPAKVIAVVAGLNEEIVTKCILESNYKMQNILAEWDKLLAIHGDECIKESGVYENVRDIENFVTFPNYYGFKSYTKCQQNRLQILDAEGNLNVTRMTALVAGVNEEVVATCIPEVLHETNLYDKAYYFARCCTFEVMSRFYYEH
ncbi:hypothetical protein FQA39_LY08008 [Lamprigera yunnana]|nr:hypothetical protein FQA39_LY08008 [Lamprigera yunnana]